LKNNLLFYVHFSNNQSDNSDDRLNNIQTFKVLGVGDLAKVQLFPNVI
jgi:hypothetical protein